MLRKILILAVMLSPAAARAQEVDEQLWLAANAETKSADTTFTLETIGRFSDRAAGFSHAEIGGSASVKLSSSVELAGGYRHVQDWDHGRTLANEERLRQLITVSLGGGLAVRMRFEQRFHSAGGEIGLRVRPQLRFNRPIGSRGFAVFATHEEYWNFNRTAWGQRGGFERMRNAAGLSIPLSKALRGDVGYLNQYRFGRQGARDRMDHAATWTMTYSF